MKKTVFRVAQKIRDIGQPVWSVKLGRYTVWQYLSRLYYSLPMAPQSVHLPWGHTLWFPKGFSARLEYLAGNYEPELTQLVKERVRQGMTVVDRGANIGYYTLLFSHLVGASGKVYAFEPDPIVYQALLVNVSKNKLPNVEVHECALGRAFGKAQFRAVGGVSSAFVQDADELPNDRVITVPVANLDALLRGRERVDFVKLDVEGAEVECLEGMREIIAKNPEISVVFEINSNIVRVGMDELFEILKELGFRTIYAIEPHLHIASVDDLLRVFNGVIAQRNRVFNLLCTRH
jgi:FkbM family methyltransferase